MAKPDSPTKSNCPASDEHPTEKESPGNPRLDFETAVLQWTQIFGLITGHHTGQEIVGRFAGFMGQSPAECEKLKDLVVRNAFRLLEVAPPRDVI